MYNYILKYCFFFIQALELLRDYKPGFIENGAKLEILFCIIRESIALGDRLLVFSQSLITLDLIEQFLQSSLVPGDTINWAKNVSYYSEYLKTLLELESNSAVNSCDLLNNLQPNGFI